mgnify:CR=1 FL=1
MRVRVSLTAPYLLKFNAKTEFVEFIQEDWKPFKNIKIVENTDGAFIFTINDDNENWYQLFKRRGGFGLSINSLYLFNEKGRSVARCPKLCFNNPYMATISNNQITQIIE